VGDVVVCVVAADAFLELKYIGDGVVELSALGAAIADDL
jgi:hypothetical protein